MDHEQLQRTLGGPVVFGAPQKATLGHRFWKRAEANLWCAQCTRVFPNGLLRIVEDRATCPYADCTGVFATQVRFWSEVRALHPNYPEHPNMAVQYVCPPWSKAYRHPGRAVSSAS
jgi:hypothetical protein